MIIKEGFGFAVVDGGAIKVCTVSDTRRAALVNFLAVERACFITNHMSDEHIERLWFQYRGNAEVEYVTVRLANTAAAVTSSERSP